MTGQRGCRAAASLLGCPEALANTLLGCSRAGQARWTHLAERGHEQLACLAVLPARAPLCS